MIIYSTRTKRLPLNIHFVNDSSTGLKMFRYDENLMSSCGDYKIQEQVTSDVFFTYNALVKFNNILDSDVINVFTSLDNFLQEHQEVKDSKDYKCKNYYNKMTYWNNKYKADSSDKSIKEIISDIQDLMKCLAKQEIIKKSGCNIKRNYY